MDSVVCPMRCTDKVLRIEDRFIITHDLIRKHCIHVMDVDPSIDLETGNAQITAFISSDDLVANLLPLSGSVETLIDVPIESESHAADSSS